MPDHVPSDRMIDFDLNTDAGMQHDFFGAWAKLQDNASKSLMWSPHNGGHWILMRAEHFRDVLGDTETYSSKSISLPPDITSATAFIPLQLDPPDHDPFRRIIAREFGPAHITALIPNVRDLTSTLIDRLLPRGECEFVADFAEVLPVNTFLTLIGLPTDDAPMLRELVVCLNNPTREVDGAELVRRVDAYLAPHVQARLDYPGSDLFSRILSQSVGDRRWTHEEAMRMCRNLLFGGLDTVVSLLSFVTLFLASSLEDQNRLRSERSLIPLASHELIRRFGTVTLGRIVTRDVQLDGVTLRKGDMVAVPLVLHNIDELWLPDARAVILDRGPTRHMSMGWGVHRCVGEGLARMELICFLEEWLARVPPFSLNGNVSMRAGGVGAVATLPIRWEL